MRRPKYQSFRRLHCEILEPRHLLANAPFSPVFDLQVDTGVIFNETSGEVSAWNDQGSGENHLRSSGAQRPAFGAVQTPTGLNAISFDGIDDRLLRDANDPGGIVGPPTNDKSRSMFLVARFHDATSFGGATYGRGALDQAFGLGVAGPGADHGELGVQVWPDDNTFLSNSDGFTSPGNSTGWMVLSVVHERDGFNPAENNWLYRNGVEIGSWDYKLNTKLHSTLNLNGNAASRMVLGEDINERGNIAMDVAAWLVYDDALSPMDRASVEGFLTATYLNAGTNEAPTAVDDFFEIAAGSTTSLNVLGNDFDSDGFLDATTVSIVNPPSQANSISVVPATGVVSYTHNGSSFNDSFTYAVRDNLGEISNFANVAIVVSTDVLPVTAGLVTQFEADAGVALGPGSQVASWSDTSGTGIVVSASGDPQRVAGATPSGRPAIVFDGAGDKLEVAGNTAIDSLPAGNEDRTVFVVANYIDTQGVQAGFAYGKANSNRTFGVGADGPTGNLAVQGYLGSNDLVSSASGVGFGWHLQSVVLDNSFLRHFENGVLIDSWNHTYATRVDAPTSKIVIGQSLDESGYSELQLGAVLVYDRALSDSERQQVENYLANKYTSGQSSNQPPTANDDSYTTTVGGVINITQSGLPTVLANDTDPNFDPLTAILVSGPTQGTLTLNANGSFVYTHTGSTSADDSFTYRANDGTVNSNIATVNLTITPLASGNSQIVRWHGDYYQHLWDSTYPGGSNPTVRENRWLRGGPALGSQNSLQNLDLDNDGQFDDSRVFFDFSLTDPLNPPDTTSKPNGIYYHSELPSAKFYGGLSAEFFNYETDRVQQAFIENDGAGGELDDVGYPSPYLTPEFEGLSDYIELVRHPDGRPKKSHVGPHEDFAINIYRPDLPHPINAGDIPADNLVTFHAAFMWRKEDFLAGGATQTVSLDSESTFSFESTRWWDNIGEARWIVQSGTGQLYISQYAVTGVQDDWGTTNTLADPLSSNWAVYNPTASQLNFNQNAANWINPVSNNLFNNIQAVGLYIENDVPSGALTKFSLDEIQFNAVVGGGGALAASSSETTSDSLSSVYSLDSLTPTQFATETTTSTFVSDLVVEATFAESILSRLPVDSSSTEDDIVAASRASQDSEALATELGALDEVFAQWS